MKVYPDKLEEQLQKTLAPLYYISGDEPLQIEEACDQVRKAARSRGYTERDVFFEESQQGHWDDILASANSLSLFSDKKIIEVRLRKGKPNDKQLLEYLKNPNPDTILLIVSDKAEAKSQWFTALDKHGAMIQVWPIEHERFPQWLQQRCKRAGLQLDNPALVLLAERVEGNLLAATQEIQKLLLLYGNNMITADMLDSSVENSARHDVYTLITAAFNGNTEDTLRMLHGLQAEGEHPLLVISAVGRELRKLAGVCRSVSQGEHIDWALKKHNVWGNAQQAAIKSSLKRHQVPFLESLLQKTAAADQMVKGMRNGEPWHALENIFLKLCGKETLDS